MRYRITANGENDERSISKQQFEDLLLENNNMIPNDIDTVVIYCASWSCNGAKNYFKKLVDRNKVKSIPIEKPTYTIFLATFFPYARFAKSVIKKVIG